MGIIQSFVSIQASFKIQSFNQNEIIALIPEKIMKEVKAIDTTPFFQCYSIIHEGISQPQIIGEKSQPIVWTRKAIQSLRNIITAGVKLFLGHNVDSSHDDRRVIGKVIHSFEKEIDGKLHHCAITYHDSDVKNEVLNYDICSHEGIWNLFEKAGQLVADTITKLTGIALVNSEHETPAFSGAKRLGFIQALEAKAVFQEMKIMGSENNGVIENQQMTFDEWKRKGKDFNVYPHQMFSEEDLVSDREFGKIFDKIKRLEETKTDLTTKLKTSDDNLQNQIGKFLNEQNKSKSVDVFTNVLKTNEMPENMEKFIKKAFETGKDKIIDLSAKGITEFVDTQKTAFQNLMSILEPEIPTDKNVNEEDKNEDEMDYSDPENNEFLNEEEK